MADQLTDGQILNDQGRNTATHQTSYSYDVFLSYCGPDTRRSFTGSLHRALTEKGFKVFMDVQAMKPGDRISRTLVNAIRQSRISIVVLSQNYASSTWCLDELVEILECMRRKNQLVWPIFYRVAPSDVRHQRKSYAEAMAKHEESFGDKSHEVQKWRSALTEVAGVQGWPNTTGQYDYELIEEIVKHARTELEREKKEDEKKKEPAPDPVMEMELVKAYRAYNPHMTTHYYVQSVEEDPAPELEARTEPEREKKEDEKKKEPAPDSVMELVKAYRAYNPYLTTYYYVQSVEENPNACVIC